MKTVADVFYACPIETRKRIEKLAMSLKKDICEVIVSLLSEGASTYPDFIRALGAST